MADTWDAALKRAFAKNKKRGQGPTSGRALSFALGGNPETARRTINRVRERNRATEQVAQALSAGLGVPRRDLPAAAKRPTIAEVEDRLAEVEDALLELAKEARVDLEALAQRMLALERRSPGGSGEASETPS